MPAVDQAYRTRPRKRKTTSRGPQGLPTVRTPIVRPPVVSHSSAPAFKPLTTTRPFAPAQRQARKRSQAARRKVPSSPRLKRPPLIPPEQLTSPQRQALVRAGRAALNRARGNQSVQQFYETASPLDRKLIRHISRVDAYERAAGGGTTDPRFVAKGTSARDSHVKLPFATIDVSAAGRAVAGLTKLSKSSTPQAKFVKAALGDVKSLGESPFVGGYELGAGTYETIRHGDTSRLRALASGIASGAAQEVQHPIESFRNHPLLTALDVSAAGSVVGHTAGALARGLGSEAAAEGVRGALARAGSTERSPLALTTEAGSRLVHQRGHSRDLIRKQFERAADATREPLRDSHGKVVTHRLPSGRVVPVLKASDTELPFRSQRQRLQDRRTDFVASRTNSTNRLVRERAARDLRKLSPTYGKLKHRSDREMVPLALEGTFRSAKSALSDLRAHRAKLKATIDRAEKELNTARKRGESKQSVYRTKVELAAAKDRLRTIDRFLASKPSLARLQAILRARGEIGKRLNAGDLSMAQNGLGNLHQLRRSRLFPYAQEHMGAVHAEDAAGNAALRHPDGRFMSNTEIEQHMRDSGVDPNHVAYLPHRADVRGARAFYSQFRGGGRPTLKNEPRTGKLYERGATGTKFETVQDHAVRQETQVAKAQAIDRFVHDTGLKAEDGRYFTGKEGRETADRLAKDTGEEWVPISAVPAKLDRDVVEAVKQGQDPRALEGLSEKLINSRIEFAKNTGKRNVVLVPKRMIDRLAAHVAPANGLERALQYINRPFRFTVLATPHWIAQNFIEPMLVRLPTVGSGVIVPGLAADLRAFHKVLGKERSIGGVRIAKAGALRADPKLASIADEIEAELQGGLMIGGRGLSNRRTLEDLPGMVRYGKVMAHLPVVKQVGWFGKHATTIVGHGFFAANRILEGEMQKAAIGRLIRRDVQEFSGSYLKALKMGDTVSKQMARGLTNTGTMQRYASHIDELLGKYSRWSPAARRLIQTAFPFVPWTLAAARFVYWTMPAHNTVKTAVLIKAAQVEQEAWDQEHVDTPPGDLRLALRRRDGGYVNIAGGTPYGLTGPILEGDLGSLTSPLLPQASGVLHAIEGQDPFGNPLRTAEGEATPGQRAKIAANQLAEAFIPNLRLIRNLREGGGTAYANSTVLSPKVKPGSSHMSAANRTFNPFRPTYLNAPTGTSAKPGVDWHAARAQHHGGTGVDWHAAGKAVSGGTGVDWKAAGG